MLLAVSSPDNNIIQDDAYNGQEREHSMNFKTVKEPDETEINSFCLLKCCRYNWRLPVRSDLEEWTHG